MRIKNISWELLLYLAIVEAFSLWIQELMLPYVKISSAFLQAIVFGFLTGFFGLFFTIEIYNVLPLKLKLNKKPIKRVNVLAPCLLNAVFLAIAFMIQISIEKLEHLGLIGYALFGFISIGLAAFLSILIYNNTNFKIKFYFSNKLKTIKKINLNFALFAGFFDFFIIPFMFVFYANNVPSFANGFLSGLLGSLVPFFITNFLLERCNIRIKI